MSRSKKAKPALSKSEARIQFDPKVMAALVPGPLTVAEANELFHGFKKAVFERALGAELTHHLGYGQDEPKPAGQSNHRNGSSAKTVATDTGEVKVEIPRDREGSFEPLLIGKHERRFSGFDDKIVAMYARGMTVREIQAHLTEMYAVEVSPSLISEVTDAVMGEVTEWQARPLDPMYPVVFFDALRVKIRDEGVVRNKAVYLALGVDRDGQRDVLGLWIEQTEGAKFWMKVVNDLRNRGVEDVLIAVVDGLKGFPEAIAAVFPKTHGPDLHRASDPQQPRLRELEGPQARRRGAAAGLHGAERDGRGGCPGGLRGRPLGDEVPDHRAELATRLGACDPVLRVSAGGAADHLHDQRDREPAHAAAQDHQDARPLPHRRGGHEADLARAAQRDEESQPRRSRVDQRDESVRVDVPGSLPGAGGIDCRGGGFAPCPPKCDGEISSRERQRQQTSDSSTCLSTQKSGYFPSSWPST